ncbi:universal stress protein [Petrachloros mirabilis]
MATITTIDRFLPQAHQISGSVRSVKKFLVAVDESEHSLRAVRYVGSVLRDMREASVTLFHVLKPMPRGLLEHGGSENPAEEVRLAKELQQEQEKWVRAESARESPILTMAANVLQQSGFPQERVTLKFSHDDHVARHILDEARAGGYGTIVVSRQGSNVKKRLLAAGITDQLLRDASGVTLWVVD